MHCNELCLYIVLINMDLESAINVCTIIVKRLGILTVSGPPPPPPPRV